MKKTYKDESCPFHPLVVTKRDGYDFECTLCAREAMVERQEVQADKEIKIAGVLIFIGVIFWVALIYFFVNMIFG